MTNEQINFLLEEYKALREEILFLVKQSYITENAVIIGTAAFYSWLIIDLSKSSTNTISSYLWWVPVAAAIIGISREIGLRNRILHIAGYIAKIEANIFPENELGWEHYLEKIRQQMKGNILGITSGLFWASYFILSIVLAILNTEG